MYNNQNGAARAKVLIFVVALCVVSLIALKKIRVNTMINQIANLGATVAQQSAHASEIIEKYKGDYALFLYKTNNLPAGLSYDNGLIQAANSAKIKATVDADGIVLMEISNLNTDSCVKIATKNWGYRQTTHFVGTGIGGAPDFSCLKLNNCKFNYVETFSGTADYPFTVDRATYPCSLYEQTNQPASVYLGYKL